MIKIAHRINSTELLRNVPRDCGIEVDIRSNNSKLILDHDFPARGEELQTFLASYNHKLLVLNVKEDGLEDAILSLPTFKLNFEYFFLDQPIPTMLKSTRAGITTSIRASEYEQLPTRPTGASWIWIDSFGGNWDHVEDALNYASEHQMRTCLVAPELQGRWSEAETENLQRKYSGRLDAVCTKQLSVWE